MNLPGLRTNKRCRGCHMAVDAIGHRLGCIGVGFNQCVMILGVTIKIRGMTGAARQVCDPFHTGGTALQDAGCAAVACLTPAYRMNFSSSDKRSDGCCMRMTVNAEGDSRDGVAMPVTIKVPHMAGLAISIGRLSNGNTT